MKVGYNPVLELGVGIVGAAIGVAGFVPLVVGLRLARKASATSNLGQAGALLLGLLISFLLLSAALIAGVLLIRPQIMVYSLAVAGGLSAVAIGYGIHSFVTRK